VVALGKVFVATLAELRRAGRLVVSADGHTVLLVYEGGRVYALDNRCPHMGFPLHWGTVRDGVLTCHWHHARFDLRTGGTFDLWADDVRTFPVEIRGDEVWVDISPRQDLRAHQLRRLREGLERGIPLVLGKAVIALWGIGEDPQTPFRIGLEFGARHRRAGWGPGLTILACMQNLLPLLEPEDRPLALYHGLSAVAADTEGESPRFPLAPLPGSVPDLGTLRRWFRHFVEVRDLEAAERCIVTAVRAGADARQMTDLLGAAATDHRYASTGHLLDFTNKALEALEAAGWDLADVVLPSLAPGYAEAERMEESSRWRTPIDLVAILEGAFERLPAALEAGRDRRGRWQGWKELVTVLLGADPAAIAHGLVDALREGATEEEVGGAVAYAAALRIAHFSLANEFSDWDTALHTFTFANAAHHMLRRSPSPELLRGVFDAAMSVYLDRFLNVPPAPLPEPAEEHPEPDSLLPHLADLLDRQGQVDEAADLVARYLRSGGDPDRLLAHIGALLLREDRNFHTIQMVEAAARQFGTLRDSTAREHVLVAAVRYLAAHAPTRRAQLQTYRIAWRLHRGERLYAD
jgi:nitrite reductase/ring-hydroxylating ferredoxin subunit